MTEPTPSITCPVCERTSYHPEDVRQGYCGNCHAFAAFALATTPGAGGVAALICNGCGSMAIAFIPAGVTVDESAEVMLAEAREHGWLRIDATDYCPDCLPGVN